MKKSIFLPLLIIILLLLNVTLKAELQNHVTISNDRTTLALELTYTNYTDIDFDGVEDDVIGNFTINLESELKVNIFAIEALLTLPLGNSFYYLFIFITYRNYLDLTLYMCNTDIEAGRYTLALTAILFLGGQAEGTAYYVFDPGEVGGGDPIQIESQILKL